MQSTKPVFSAASFAAASRALTTIAAWVVASSRSAPQSQPALPARTGIPGTEYAALADELADQYLDVESARLALVKLAQTTAEPMLRNNLASLRGPVSYQLFAHSYLFGYWQIHLEDRTWWFKWSTPDRINWSYRGDFCRNREGEWVARLLGKGGWRI